MGILLEALPGFTWWGGFAVTGIIGIVSYLFKAALEAEKDKRRDMDRQIKEQDKRMDEMRESNDRRLNEMKDQVHRLQVEILTRINEVGIKLESFRRDLSK